MTTLPNLPLNTWDAGNAQPDLLYNDLLSAVDAMMPTAVITNKDSGAPPSTPTLGSVYIIGPSATGIWTGREGQLAAFTYANSWKFFVPKNGWLVYVADEDAEYRFDGTDWNVVTSGGGGGIPDAPSDGTTYGRKDGGWVDVGSAVAGVSDVNGVTGSVTIAAGLNVTVDEDSSGTITISSTGGLGGGGTQRGGFTDPTTTDGDLLVRYTTSVTDLSVLFIGDSITSGQLVTTAPVDPACADMSFGDVTVHGVNSGVPGSTTAGWLPGTTNMNTALAAGLADGSRVAHIMLGTNDSGGPVSQADYRENMVAICGELVQNGYIVVVSYPPYAPDHIAAVTSYCEAIDSLVDNFHVFQGDTQAQTYFHDNPSALQPDNIHPTQAGSNTLAGFWAEAMLAIVNGLTNTVAMRRATLSAPFRIDTSGSDPSITSDVVLRFAFAAAVANSKRRLALPQGVTIEGWEVLADASGSLVLDIWADTYANYPPTSGDSICASAKPTLSSASKGKSSSLTGWTTELADDSTIIVNVDSITTIAEFELSLRCVYGAASPPAPTVTWNPSDRSSNIGLSGADLVATRGAGGSGSTFAGIRCTLQREASTAAHYFTVVTSGTSGSQTTIGVALFAADVNDAIGADANAWTAYGNDGGGFHAGSHTTYGSGFGSSGDEILFLLKAGKVYWRLNGTWQGSGNPVAGTGSAFTGLSGAMYPACSMLNSGQVCTADFSSVDGDSMLAGCAPWDS